MTPQSQIRDLSPLWKREVGEGETHKEKIQKFAKFSIVKKAKTKGINERQFNYLTAANQFSYYQEIVEKRQEIDHMLKGNTRFLTISR